MAYKAVMRPKEGTILTVARVIAEEAVKQAQSAPNDYDALMRVILASGENILKLTTDMLPALKQAGVVDAGGRGLLCIYAGYAAALGGEHIDLAPVDAAAPVEDFVDDHDEESKYTYCTQFLIQHLRMDAKPSNIATFRRPSQSHRRLRAGRGRSVADQGTCAHQRSRQGPAVRACSWAN